MIGKTNITKVGTFTGLKFTAAEAGAKISYKIYGLSNTPDMKYSFDEITWYNWAPNTDITLNNIYDFIYVKGNNPNGWGADHDYGPSKHCMSFVINQGKINASGNINSLLDDSNGSSIKTLPAKYCYTRLFDQCTDLLTAPQLPSLTLTEGCYGYMFEECTSLTTIPYLRATNLASGCYIGMFRDCTSLVNVSALPALILKQMCYAAMFAGCTSLTTAPEINALFLDYACFNNMFLDCTSLNNIKITYDGDFESEYFYHWVENVSSSGTFCYTGYDTTEGVSAIPENWNLVTGLQSLKFTSAQNNSSISYSLSSENLSPNIQYSFDGNLWRNLDPEVIVTLNQNKYIYLKGSNVNGLSTSLTEYINFNMTGRLIASGNINSLIDNSNGDTITTLPSYCYCKLFKNCESLLQSPFLLATTIGTGCYQEMFQNCTNLINVPKLPATSINQSCYQDMFNGCTTITSTQELPAIVLYQSCYESMFANCTSLTEAKTLPATTLAERCYYEMFKNCINLVTASKSLPAYILPATCYESMFRGCSNLIESPILYGTTLSDYCYSNMFYNCKNLNKITIAYTGNFNSTYFNNWVYNVASSGDFYYNGNDTSNIGYSAIPTGWTIQNTENTIVYEHNSIKSNYSSDPVSFIEQKTVNFTGLYRVTLKGQQGTTSTNSEKFAKGGSLTVTKRFNEGDILYFRRINGAYQINSATIPGQSYYWYGGCGVALSVKGKNESSYTVELVAGGGGSYSTWTSGSTTSHNAIGGGGYIGGYGYFQYNLQGYSVDGSRGNSTSENVAPGGGKSTYNGYGGTGYIKSDYTIESSIYATNEDDGYIKLEFLHY